MTVKGGLHHLVDDLGEDADIDAEIARGDYVTIEDLLER